MIPDLETGKDKIDVVVVDEEAVGSIKRSRRGAKILYGDGAFELYLSQQKSKEFEGSRNALVKNAYCSEVAYLTRKRWHVKVACGEGPSLLIRSLASPRLCPIFICGANTSEENLLGHYHYLVWQRSVMSRLFRLIDVIHCIGGSVTKKRLVQYCRKNYTSAYDDFYNAWKFSGTKCFVDVVKLVTNGTNKAIDCLDEFRRPPLIQTCPVAPMIYQLFTFEGIIFSITQDLIGAGSRQRQNLGPLTEENKIHIVAPNCDVLSGNSDEIDAWEVVMLPICYDILCFPIIECSITLLMYSIELGLQFSSVLEHAEKERGESPLAGSFGLENNAKTPTLKLLNRGAAMQGLKLGHFQSESEFKEAEAGPTRALLYIITEVFKTWKLNNSSNTSLTPKALSVETTVEQPLPTTSSPLTITRNLLPQLEAVANSKGKKEQAASPMIDDSDYDPSEISPTNISNSTAGADSVSFIGPNNAAKLVNPRSATWKQVDPNPNPLQSILNSESPTPFANPVATLSSLLPEPKKLSTTFVFSSPSLERPKLPTLRHKHPLKNLEAVGAIGEEIVLSENGNGGVGNTESEHNNAHIHFSDADIGGKCSLLEVTMVKLI
ncbi:hypothetical protein IFM89_017286 [Coptis chinensis]|uniref:Uncharacterized protein n=1 Tax=Coptis chinensis TaxID=261450 RepID=A0A835M888_9MAGN|nr:hypothetical protein IFM89_017286 [Coptis chinensis]